MSAVKKEEKCAYHLYCLLVHEILTYITSIHSFKSSASPSPTNLINSLAELEALHILIGSSISQIKRQMSASDNAVPFPSLDTPFTPESEIPRNSPEVMDAAMHIVSAAYHMIAIVRHPGLSIMTSTLQFYVPAAIRFVVEAHVVEILRDAGPEGLHVDDIARVNGVDAQKLGRLLRLLATSHIFNEVSPDVFSNNRISSMLDTGKSVTECLNNPLDKFVNAPGIAPLVVHTTAHCFPAATELVSALLPYNSPYSSPAFSTKNDLSEFVHSQAPNQAPFNIAFDTGLAFWEWMGEKDDDGKLIRKNDERLFSLAMKAVKKVDEANRTGSVFEGFNWKDLPERTVVVDVGGGIGSQTLAIAKHHKQINVVVQDFESVLSEADKYWETNLPDAINNGKVKFQPHNFFKPMPAIPFDFDPLVKIYFLHHILHDWSDMYCLKILKNLRETCHEGQDTVLIIGDSIIDYACDITEETLEDNVCKMPKPLLANGGQATIFEYLLDIQMLAAINGQERTLPQLRSILNQSGWKLKKVYARESATAKRFVVAVPV